MKIINTLSIVAATSLVLASCDKNGINDYAPTKPIGGYSSSADIASDNLVAHWSFDTNGNEDISGAAPASEVNATYVEGKKGKALNLAHGYVAYPEMAALNNLPSYTISAWVNIANNKGLGVDEGSSAIFTMTRNTPDDHYEWAGNVTFSMENAWYDASIDTLVVKALNVTEVDGSASWQDSRNDPAMGGDQAFKGAKKWSHVVISWNGATSMLTVYGNGKKISNPAWEQRPIIGNLSFFSPTRPVIGGWGTLVNGTPDSWQQSFNGKIDEVRVYNSALSGDDINSLYKLENLGR